MSRPRLASGSVRSLLVACVGTLVACAGGGKPVPDYYRRELDQLAAGEHASVMLQRELVSAVERRKLARVRLLVEEYGVRPGPRVEPIAKRVAHKQRGAELQTLLAAIPVDPTATTHHPEILSAAADLRRCLDWLRTTKASQSPPRQRELDRAERVLHLHVVLAIREWVNAEEQGRKEDDPDQLAKDCWRFLRNTFAVHTRQTQAEQRLLRHVPAFGQAMIVSADGGRQRFHSLTGDDFGTMLAQPKWGDGFGRAMQVGNAGASIWHAGEQIANNAEELPELGVWVVDDDRTAGCRRLLTNGELSASSFDELRPMPRGFGIAVVHSNGRWGAIQRGGKELIPIAEASDDDVLRILHESLLATFADGHKAGIDRAPWSSVTSWLSSAARAFALAGMLAEPRTAQTGGTVATALCRRFGALPTLAFLRTIEGLDQGPYLATLGWTRESIDPDLPYLDAAVGTFTGLRRGNSSLVRKHGPKLLQFFHRRRATPEDLLPGEPNDMYALRDGGLPALCRGVLSSMAVGVSPRELQLAVRGASLPQPWMRAAARLLGVAPLWDEVELAFLGEHYERWSSLTDLYWPVLERRDPRSRRTLRRNRRPEWVYDQARIAKRTAGDWVALVAHARAGEAKEVPIAEYRLELLRRIASGKMFGLQSPFFAHYRQALANLSMVPGEHAGDLAHVLRWFEGIRYQQNLATVRNNAATAMREAKKDRMDPIARAVLHECHQAVRATSKRTSFADPSEPKREDRLKRKLAELGADEPIQLAARRLLRIHRGLLGHAANQTAWQQQVKQRQAEITAAAEAERNALEKHLRQLEQQRTKWSSTPSWTPSARVNFNSAGWKAWEARLDHMNHISGGGLFRDWVSSGNSQRWVIVPR